VARYPIPRLFPYTTLFRSRGVRQAPDHAVERGGGAAPQPAVALARDPGAVDVVVALAPARDELGDQLRRILAVGVEDHGRALGRSEEHTSELQSRENLVCR